MSKPNFKKMNWLERLVYPLEHPQYPQIRKRLIKFNRKGDIIGKCAEGEIACQNGIHYDPERNELLHYNFFQMGVPRDLVEYDILPPINLNIFFVNNINEYIIALNDFGFTYKQIAEFLRTTFEDAV